MAKKKDHRSPILTQCSEDAKEDLVEAEDEDGNPAQMLAETFDLQPIHAVSQQRDDMHRHLQNRIQQQHERSSRTTGHPLPLNNNSAFAQTQRESANRNAWQQHEQQGAINVVMAAVALNTLTAALVGRKRSGGGQLPSVVVKPCEHKSSSSSSDKEECERPNSFKAKLKAAKERRAERKKMKKSKDTDENDKACVNKKTEDDGDGAKGTI